MSTTSITYTLLVEAIKTKALLTVCEANTIATAFKLLAEYIEDPVDHKGDDVYRLCQALQLSYTQFARNISTVEDLNIRNRLCAALFRVSRAVDKLTEAFEEEELSFEELAAGLTHAQAVLGVLNSNMLVTDEMGGAIKAIVQGETNIERMKSVEFRARNLYEGTSRHQRKRPTSTDGQY